MNSCIRCVAGLLLAAATATGVGAAAPAAATPADPSTPTPLCNGDSCQSTFPVRAQRAFARIEALPVPPSPIWPPVPVRQFNKFLDHFPPAPIYPPAPIRPVLIFSSRVSGP